VKRQGRKQAIVQLELDPYQVLELLQPLGRLIIHNYEDLIVRAASGGFNTVQRMRANYSGYSKQSQNYFIPTKKSAFFCFIIHFSLP
jgi:hypothetical protein